MGKSLVVFFLLNKLKKLIFTHGYQFLIVSYFYYAINLIRPEPTNRPGFLYVWTYKIGTFKKVNLLEKIPGSATEGTTTMFLITSWPNPLFISRSKQEIP
ncbi:hypothetical protein Hanom_Chr11g00978511 [Helianthus anomalus]